MTPTVALAARIREVLLHGKWIANTNVREGIEGLDWQQATEVHHGFNSIAALTFHLNYYLDGLLRAFATGRLEIRDRYSFDLPPIRSTADWERLRAAFLTNAEAFAAAVEALPDGRLDESFIEEKYGTWGRNIEGVIEHSYYHLGQITLIRKLVHAPNTGQVNDEQAM